MTHQTISRKIGAQPRRSFVVTFCDESPERAEAIAAFSCAKRALVLADPFPAEIDAMADGDAQRFLDQHPRSRQWEILTSFDENGLSDEDLRHLRAIPELKIVRIWSDEITDAGVALFRDLPILEVLHLYSKKLTDACLKDIAELKSLRSLDLAGSPGISKAALASWNLSKWANQALVPTPASVTPAADAPVAPDAGAAHL